VKDHIKAQKEEFEKTKKEGEKQPNFDKPF
jgi:hypothetical protein